MKKITLTLITLIAVLSVSDTAFSQKKKHSENTEKSEESAKASDSKIKFSKLPSGLEYAIVKDEPGTQLAKADDYVEMHIRASVGDSVLFDSRNVNHNEPVAFQLKNPTFKGDPAEGFMLLSAGDSAVFRVPVDSIRKLGNQLPPFMKDGMKIQYNVVMVSIKTAEQKKADDDAKSAKQKNIDEDLLKNYFTKNNIQATKTATGLYYRSSKPGTGNSPAPGESVTVNYTGKTLDGKTFDSNVDSNFHHTSPFSFTLGRGQVIRGWDEGLALMKKGEKGTLYIPSTLAYGEHSPSPLIPANAILVFDVELTDIKAADAPQETDKPAPTMKPATPKKSIKK